MHVKTPYPDLHIAEGLSLYDFFWDRPDQQQWPANFTFQIDATTGRKRTFKEFRERVRLAATALGASVSEGGLGIQAGEVVGVMSSNSLDYVTLIHSLLIITAPFVLIPAYWTAFELTHALELARPTRLFVHADLLRVVLPIATKINISADNVYVLGKNAEDRRSLKYMIDNTCARNIPLISPRPAARDTLAYLIFSSGTSGLSKAVMISHGNILVSVLQGQAYWEVATAVYTPPKPDNAEGLLIHLAVLPMHHAYGLHMFCFRSLLSPATYVIFEQWNLERALKAISRYKITTFSVIPSLIHQIVNHPRLKDFDLSSLQAMGSGAAYLPPELTAKLSKLIPHGVAFREGYGSSESTVSAIVQPPAGGLNGLLKHVPGSLGVLLSGMEARILREDGTNAEVNEVGELYLKGGNVALGYWRNEKATRETFVDGWLRTGDKFCVNEDGYFFFADRAKDILKISGSQVSPTEIEDALLSEPRKLITDVSVAGVTGGRMVDEKVPRAWVVLSNAGQALGADVTIRELERWHQKVLSKYKWLRGGIEVVDEIPKSPTGKVLRRVLQEQYEKKVAERVQSKL